MNVQGKVVVITGASSGIGRTTALALAREGAVLHLIARREPLLDEVAEEARRLGASATSHVLDVRDKEAMAAMAERVHAASGPVDVLINNAGVGATKEFLETTDDDWDWTFDTNVTAVVTAIRAFLPPMLERGRGTIVNVASLAGLMGNALSAYSASKFAVVGLSDSLVLEHGHRGIDVIVVCPGVINTGMPDATLEAGRTNASMGPSLKQIMSKYGASPEVVARDILRAIRRPRFLVLTPMHARALWRFHRIFPSMSRQILRRLA